jgi:eukaryotic-like serine/threonine-protein kinase
MPSFPPGFPSQLVEGAVLQGKFRIDGALGSGGMGLVIRAHHLGLDQPVALKFIRPELIDDAVATERLRREARVTAQLRSEHVRRVYDVAHLDDGNPFIVMEYLEGDDLASLLKKQGTLRPSDVAELMLQSCEAMAEAHMLGIVHRDLKPHNLFLARQNDGRQVLKVLDFGISKLSLSTALRLTRTAELLGSPAYNAPEQLRAAHEVDARTDVWSLGVVMYELLAGELPFLDTVIPRVALKILHEPAPSLHLKCSSLLPEMESVVLRCLEKEPGARYASVTELALALRPFAPARSRI